MSILPFLINPWLIIIVIIIVIVIVIASLSRSTPNTQAVSTTWRHLEIFGQADDSSCENNIFGQPSQHAWVSYTPMTILNSPVHTATLNSVQDCAFGGRSSSTVRSQVALVRPLRHCQSVGRRLMAAWRTFEWSCYGVDSGCHQKWSHFVVMLWGYSWVNYSMSNISIDTLSTYCTEIAHGRELGD